MELLFLVGCGFVGMIPSLVALMLGRPGLSSLLAVGWFALSACLLWSIGLGPHGFILFAFIPFWAGNVVALVWALVRLYKERTVV